MKPFTWLFPGILIGLALMGLSVGQSPEAPGAPANAEAAGTPVSQDFPPKKFDPRRYDEIFQRNPFMQEVLQVKPSAPDNTWAEGLIVRAVTRIGGHYVVHVENTKLTKDPDIEKRRKAYHRLVEGQGGEPLRIQSVSAHRDPRQVEVVVATGQGSRVKTATIRYDDKQLTAKAPRTPSKSRAPTTAKRASPRVPTRKPSPRTPNSTKRRVVMPPGISPKK